MFTQVTVGASELTLLQRGPIGENTTYIFSARRFPICGCLFRLFLGYPFLPTFVMTSPLKPKPKSNDKRELTFRGVRAIDQFSLNFDGPGEENYRR